MRAVDSLCVPPDALAVPVGVDQVVESTLVGVFSELRLGEVEVRLAVGDTLMRDTDGVIEARGSCGCDGAARRETLLTSFADESADAITHAILAEVDTDGG